jgi:hypothetical protein
MIPQKLEIIRRPESGKNQREVMVSCSIRSSAIYDIKETEGPVTIVYVIK